MYSILTNFFAWHGELVVMTAGARGEGDTEKLALIRHAVTLP